MAWPTKTDFVDGDVLTAAQVNNIGTNLNLFNPTSATANQVPLANGSGSVAWGSVPAGGMTLITSLNLTTDPTTISSIPQTYKDLYFVWEDAGGNANNTVSLQCGSVSALAHYYVLISYGTTVSGGRNYFQLSYTGATPRNGVITGHIYNYASTNSAKTADWIQADDWVSGSQSWVLGWGTIISTSAITSLTLDGNGMTTLGGTFNLYGVK